MNTRSTNKIVLGCLCSFVESHVNAVNDRERSKTEKEASDFLDYSGFSKDQRHRFKDNYNRLKKEMTY